MVHLTAANSGVSKTFGLVNKFKAYNHRKPIKYQRFQKDICPEEIVAHYSRDDFDKLNLKEAQRTYKDAQQTMGRKNFLLPNLSSQDLEINQLFQEELNRQRAIVARINKIKVVVDSVPGQGTELLMNKDLSTPFECARHIHDLLTTRSVVAQLFPIDSDLQRTDPEQNNDSVNDEEKALVPKIQPRSIYWDMHRPLQESCRIKFRHFSEHDVSEVNKIYWRSCSFVLGMAIKLAFKDDIKVLLHSWPKPNIKQGSFVYDVALNLNETWKPNEAELRAFTKVMWSIKSAALPFERLQVNRDTARKLFSSNIFKLTQIDSILEDASNEGKVTVYRCGGLLDLSIGPMISNTSQIGRITLASVHPFESQAEQYNGIFYRFQGVSLPQQLPMSSYLYQNVIINNAKKLNKVAL